MRRDGAGLARVRPGFRGIGGGGLPSLSLLSSGVFTRASEGSYLTGAPTDGSSAFLAWAGNNVRRIEDRGDGLGPMLLMEGSRTNYALQSRALDNAAWTAGTATVTANQNGGPDGATLADRVNATSGQAGPSEASKGQVAFSVASAWARAVSGTVQHQMVLSQGGTALAAKATARSTTYGRSEVSGNCTPGSAGVIPLDASDRSGIGGQVATAQDAYIDLVQIESGHWPTSAIRTTAAAVTRAADALSYAAGQYPAAFCDRGVVFAFAPDCSSAELAASATQFCPVWLGAGSANGIFVSSSLVVSAWLSNAQKIASSPISWSRGQLLTITVRPSAGTLTIAGASSGNGTYSGTPYAWSPSDALWIGSRHTGVDACFGRFGLNLVAA